MKLFVLSLVMIFSTQLLFSKPFEFPVTEKTTKLNISSGIEFEIKCGSKNHISIYAKDEKDFLVTLDANTITISKKKRFSSYWTSNRTRIHAKLTFKQLPNNLDFSSGTHGAIKNCDIQTDKLKLNLSSGSSLEVIDSTGSAKLLDIDMSSGALLSWESAFTTQKLLANLSSGSHFDADNNFSVEHLNAKLSSGAHFEACNTKKLETELSSGAVITVDKETERISVRKSSGAEINNGPCK